MLPRPGPYNPNLSLDYEDFRESGDLRNLKNVTL